MRIVTKYPNSCSETLDLFDMANVFCRQMSFTFLYSLSTSNIANGNVHPGSASCHITNQFLHPPGGDYISFPTFLYSISIRLLRTVLISGSRGSGKVLVAPHFTDLIIPTNDFGENLI